AARGAHLDVQGGLRRNPREGEKAPSGSKLFTQGLHGRLGESYRDVRSNSSLTTNPHALLRRPA
ncbi:MAG: hypothetical protein AAF938_27555, partial [Myxococcota bacterium]